MHEDQLSSYEAEELCGRKGGHLATIGSQRENDEINRIKTPGTWLSLGGRRKLGGTDWEWLDGRPWDFQNWGKGQNNNGDCLWMKKETGKWYDFPCSYISPNGVNPICANPPTRREGNHKLTFQKDSLHNPHLQLWWNHAYLAHREWK